MTTPLVTVVIPAFNAEDYLAEAIESVLRQDYPAIELIVVDDGSTDGTRDVMAAYRGAVRVLIQANAGTGAARNRGVDAATGDLFLFLDADDRLCPGAIGRAVEALHADRSLEAVFGRVREFISPELSEEEASRLRPPVTATGRMSGTMMIHAEAFWRVGHWSESLRMEAVEWIARADDCGLRWRTLDIDIVERRLHRGNKGRGADAARDYALALKAVIGRRRTSGQS